MKKLILFFLISFLLLINSSEIKKRLIKFNETDKGIWLTVEEIDALSSHTKDGHEVHFMDITDTPDLEKGPFPQLSPIKTELRQQHLVFETIKHIQEPAIRATITHLSNYHTRYYTTATGEAAAQWLRTQYQAAINAISNPERRARFSVELFTHTWRQPSVIARIRGISSTVGNEIVVLGGHEDSTNGGGNNRSPGADDDASGTATVLEAFRTLAANNNFNPDRTVEFHAYAAEEVGLLGSQAIAQRYRNENKSSCNDSIRYDWLESCTKSK